MENWTARARYLEVGGESVAVLDIPPGSADAGPAGVADHAGTAGTADTVGTGPTGAGVRHAPPLLVVHGFPTSSIDFQPVLTRLAEGRRVVLLDLPGYGLSAKPDRPYSLFAQADVVERVVGSLGLDEVDLLTHDMGDSVGGELLARSLDGDLPFDVRRRVLTNGSIYLDLAQLTDGQKMLLALPDEMLPEGSGLDAAGLGEVLLDLCAPDRRTPEVVDALRAGAELVAREGGGRLLPRQVRYIGERREHEGRWTGAIERHPAPLTVVWGRHDPIAVAGMAELLAGERRADAELVWLEAGHWPMIEDPAGFASAVLAGLES